MQCPNFLWLRITFISPDEKILAAESQFVALADAEGSTYMVVLYDPTHQFLVVVSAKDTIPILRSGKVDQQEDGRLTLIQAANDLRFLCAAHEARRQNLFAQWISTCCKKVDHRSLWQNREL